MLKHEYKTEVQHNRNIRNKIYENALMKISNQQVEIGKAFLCTDMEFQSKAIQELSHICKVECSIKKLLCKLH